MPIKAVIFDFGGVLLRTEDPGGRREWEKRLGLETGELDRIVFGSDTTDRSMVGLATQDDVWQRVAARLDLDDETLGELRRDFWSGDRLDVELVQFVRELHRRCKTAILSNAWPGARRAFVQRFGLGDAVDEIIVSSEECIAKPDARIYRTAAERLGVAPQEALFVDDMEENVEAARAIGMRGIRFSNTRQAIAEIQKHLDGPG
jgi:putative hydrolase of the HAD superfamily